MSGRSRGGAGRSSGLKAFAFGAVAVAGLAAGVGDALAAASDWAAEEQVRVRLVSAGQTVSGPEALLGLEFDLQPGWKIYWRSPGDAGFPPSIDWSGSQNLASGEIAWPVPHRFSLFGLETFGYGDRVVLPVDAVPADPAQPLLLTASVDYLICEEICIPYQANLSLGLPTGPETRAPEAFFIESFNRQVPGRGAERGLSLESAALTGSLEAPVLQVTARSETPFDAPDLLVEGPPGFTFAKPEVALSEDGRLATLSVATSTHLEQTVLEGKQLTLTVTDGLRGLEQPSIARFATAPVPGAGAGSIFADPAALLGLLGLALLGGLILNLMPCVLPVLSIKLLSIAEQGGKERRQIRAGFLASAAGILFSFLVLATAAVALKATGMAVGWGIQFQQPLFLSAMALVMALFAYNLMGLFEVPLPAVLGGLGSVGGANSTLAGNFGTGALATLLATPCSAPFLGTSVGFALSRGAAEIYLIFTALGIGLALPYLLVAAAPRLVSWLPRPGAWMITLRRVLGLLLAGTAVWLLSVLAVQIGLAAALVAGGLLLGLGLVLWAGPNLMQRHRLATPAAATLLAVAVLALPSGLPQTAVETRGTAAEEAWRPLDQAAIADLVNAGQVVFVDVTADWCITCQVNKKLVLDSEAVTGLLAAPEVVQMRGDWTLPSDEISAYLAGFQRYGIPFNAVYGPGAPEGLPLPELLSVDAVTEALEAAAGNATAQTGLLKAGGGGS
ncbi:protein-disulfide reductase DsbD [Pelagibius sp.]|uniref:protein-disulfide reductase DsbD family protein n=1 Tax=Pelagibius sp. TaxID=1931238 RepID=UPI0026021510|nr:protein-disulfide reductase DsbD domain-containing protein [Pelagibius sp.]